jgi:hypothetical protein
MLADTPSRSLRDPTLRSLVSLLIVLHLLCVGFVFSANTNPSALQQRLAGVLGPYTQLLHLDPGGARLQFTGSGELSDDHVIVVVPKRSDGSADETEAVRIPGSETRGTADRWRATMLANEMGAYAEREELIALFAKSIGRRVMQDRGFDHVFVRVLHKVAQPLDLSTLLPGFPADDPDAAPYFSLVYEAEVWIDEDQQVQVLKRASGLNAAPTSQGAASP